jgi:5-(carboxyamino)imidazole ribonucleotide synthase
MVEMEFNPEANLVEFLIAPSTLPFAIQHGSRKHCQKIAETLKLLVTGC